MWIKLSLLFLLSLILMGVYWLVSSVFFLETAPYVVTLKEGEFEIREYSQLAVVTAAMQSTEGDSAFRKLFQFIQGQNAREEKIAMTTPVFVDDGKMSFVVPEATLRNGVPHPTGEGVAIEERAPVRVAAFRFSGYATEDSRSEALAALRGWLSEKGFNAEGEAFFAYYDAPFVPGPFRRNEVMLRFQPIRDS
jgi:hypothetical protein